MPATKRGDIGSIKPTGWKQAKYRGVTDDGVYDQDVTQYLYNRCHLLAYELTGENANERNLITGTRAMNIAMTDFENKTANYVKDTGNNVLYRVTPVFDGNDLLAKAYIWKAHLYMTKELHFLSMYLFITYSQDLPWIIETEVHPLITETRTFTEESHNDSAADICGICFA